MNAARTPAARRWDFDAAGEYERWSTSMFAFNASDIALPTEGGHDAEAWVTQVLPSRTKQVGCAAWRAVEAGVPDAGTALARL